MRNERQDVYTRITDKIIADLEQGVRTWMKPWNAGHTAGRITRPLRHNGQPYSGINILMLWAESVPRASLSHLDDIPAGLRTQRPCPEGRERLSGCLREFHHPH